MLEIKYLYSIARAINYPHFNCAEVPIVPLLYQVNWGKLQEI